MKRILIIEDERAFLEVLEEALQQEGFEVTHASNGEDGLEMALKAHPDLLVVDVGLPRMDGLAVVESLRKDPAWGEHVSVVFLTNLNADDEIIKKIDAQKPAFYLVKTQWGIADVVGKIKECLSAQ